MQNKEVYGIRCLDNDAVQFEFQFRSFGELEKEKVKKQLIKTEFNNRNVFQIYKAFSTSNNIFCPNWDENRFFVWVDTELSVIKDLLVPLFPKEEQNSKSGANDDEEQNEDKK